MFRLMVSFRKKSETNLKPCVYGEFFSSSEKQVIFFYFTTFHMFLTWTRVVLTASMMCWLFLLESYCLSGEPDKPAAATRQT